MSCKYFILTKPFDKDISYNNENQIIFLNNQKTYILPHVNIEYYMKYGLFESNLIDWSRQFCNKSQNFLDIGAHDGITFSSTRKLFELGWSGVYVEPSPDVLPLLYKNAGSNCTVLPVAIGTSNASMTFYSSGQDMVGSLYAPHVEIWKNHVEFTKTVVDVITVDELEKRVGHQFDFIGIDVEGINLDVFNQFDWNKWNPKCVCVEYESHKDHITDVMTNAGYTLLYTSSENLVFTR
jgi:FkbM family methyltransferase